MITESFEKPNDKFQEMDSHFQDFKEIKNSSQHLDGLQFQMQQSRPSEAGTRGSKSNVLDKIATKARGRRTNTPEQQQQQSSPSYGPLPQHLQQPPWSQPPPLCLSRLRRHRSFNRCNTINRRFTSLGRHLHRRFWLRQQLSRVLSLIGMPNQ